MDLKDLAAQHDPDSRETFVSLYADLADPGHAKAIEARARQVRAALQDAKLQANFDEALVQALRELGPLRGRGARGAAVFASPAHDLLEAHGFPEALPTALVLDAGPYIRPLARYLDEHEAFVLVLLDGQRAAVYLVAAGKAELAASRRTRLLGRHTKGGWSQMRYQRHRQGALDRYYDEVAELAVRALAEAGAKRAVLAGPGQAKRALLTRAPPALAEAIIAVEDVDFAEGAEDAMVRRFVALARAEEAEASEEALRGFRAELLRGELAITGAFPVARAARDGQVELLLVRKGHVAGGAKCEAHQAFFEPGAACHCGSKGTGVDLLNEAVEATLRADGRVEFVDDADGALRGLGGAGALLRW